MSRQFRSDDTDAWKEGFGKGSLGDITISGNTTLSSTQKYYASTFTGTSGNTTGSLGTALNYSGWCIIIQVYGTGATNWELNYLQNASSSSTATLKYPLQRSYVTGAQLVTSGDYKNWVINANLTVPAWNGSVGGVCFLHAKQSISGSGAILGNGATGGTSTGTGLSHTSGGGGRGGSGRNNSGGTGQAYRGDGTISNVTTTYLNGGGSGGGGAKGDDQVGGGGANGGNGVNGQDPGRTGEYGRGGAAVGDAGLTLMAMGAGGGGGSRYASAATWGSGGSGGAIVILIAPTINISSLTVNLAGGNGGSAFKGSGGGGAGGSFLAKGVDINIGTNKISTIAGVGPNNDIKAGNGAKGRVNIDYSGSLSGSLSSTYYESYSTRNDLSIKEVISGNNFFLVM